MGRCGRLMTFNPDSRQRQQRATISSAEQAVMKLSARCQATTVFSPESETTLFWAVQATITCGVAVVAAAFSLAGAGLILFLWKAHGATLPTLCWMAVQRTTRFTEAIRMICLLADKEMIMWTATMERTSCCSIVGMVMTLFIPTMVTFMNLTRCHWAAASVMRV